jgi:hypothetical protein
MRSGLRFTTLGWGFFNRHYGDFCTGADRLAPFLAPGWLTESLSSLFLAPFLFFFTLRHRPTREAKWPKRIEAPGHG